MLEFISDLKATLEILVSLSRRQIDIRSKKLYTVS